MNIDEFIVKHNAEYKNYCEAVIFPNGDIDYARPSHQHRLMMCYGLTEEDIWNQTPKYRELTDSIPLEAGPTQWMVEDTGVASVWYNIALLSIDYTEAQVKSIKKLIKEGCMWKQPEIDVSIEKTLLRIRFAASQSTLEGLFNRKKLAIKRLKEVL